MSTAHATTIVPVPDAALAAQADAIVLGTVDDIAMRETTAGVLETVVTLTVMTALKGDVRHAIAIVVPGGVVGERALIIPGVPAFERGETALVFLEQRADGRLGVLNMALGKFRQEFRGAASVFTRDLATTGATIITPTVAGMARGQQRRGAPEERAAPALLATIAEAVQQKPAVKLRPVPKEQRARRTAAVEAFTLFGNVRRFEPDTGATIAYYQDAVGDPKLGVTGSRTAMEQAFAAWTNVPTASILLAAGPAIPPPVNTFCDGKSTIIFNDPYNQVTDPVGCGGILAIGGYCAGSSFRTVNGVSFRQATEGDIVFNNGWEACGSWNATNIAEVATHEVGHTIGLGHSGEFAATMAAYAHFDGRGASLKDDDVAGIAFIYPAASDPGAPDRTPTPKATPTITASPSVTATKTPKPITITVTCTRVEITGEGLDERERLSVTIPNKSARSRAANRNGEFRYQAMLRKPGGVIKVTRPGDTWRTALTPWTVQHCNSAEGGCFVRDP
jgi:hypothetical protein